MTTINVVFDDVWLTSVADPTVSVHASYPERAHAAQVDGEVRTYAGGRRRVIKSARKSATYPLTLQLLTAADLAQVEAWQGQLLLLRDGAGRRVFGSYLAVDVEDLWDEESTVSNVSLTFTEVDYTEGV